MKVQIKRAYDDPAEGDGYRVLVDRLWPRGIKKEVLAVDEWCKDVAPSTELRTWFDHGPAKFDEFSQRYQAELSESSAGQELLARAAEAGRLTLVYAAKDPEINHAKVLKGYLQAEQ